MNNYSDIQINSSTIYKRQYYLNEITNTIITFILLFLTIGCILYLGYEYDNLSLIIKIWLIINIINTFTFTIVDMILFFNNYNKVKHIIITYFITYIFLGIYAISVLVVHFFEFPIMSMILLSYLLINLLKLNVEYNCYNEFIENND
jgi:hypothetical protein